MKRTIRILITGGTFDKHYDEIKEILKYVRCTLPLELELNQLIDSLEMHLSNRIRILESCRRAPEDRLVITHGTDTMIQTARVLGEAGLPKTIVLTGAMVPYAVAGSDALFNLGCAIAAVQLLEPGVYLAMNGRVFRWDNVRKNREAGVFEEERG